MTSVLFYKPESDLNDLSRNEDKIIQLGNGEIGTFYYFGTVNSEQISK